MLNIINSYFSEEQIDDILKEVKHIENKPDRKNYIWKYYESDKKTISRIEKFVEHSSKLKEISDVFFKNSNYTLFKDKINFKYPGGEGFKPHQDVNAGWLKYGQEHINIAIPLHDTTIQNGCIYFSNIKEKKMLTPLFTDLTDDIIPKKLFNPCPTKKGDIIIFDSYIPHTSYINNSNENRIILFFTYILNSKHDSIYEKYYNDKFINNPPDIHKITGKEYRSNNSHTNNVIYN